MSIASEYRRQSVIAHWHALTSLSSLHPLCRSLSFCLVQILSEDCHPSISAFLDAVDEAMKPSSLQAPSNTSAERFPDFGLATHLTRTVYFESVQKTPQLQRAIRSTSSSALQLHHGKRDMAVVLANILSEGAGHQVVNVVLTRKTFTHEKLATALVGIASRLAADNGCRRIFSLSAFFPADDVQRFNDNVVECGQFPYPNARARAQPRPRNLRPTTDSTGEKRFFRYLAWGAVDRLKDVKPEDKKARQA